MVVLREREEGKKENVAFANGAELMQKRSIFGRYTDAEMLSKLRELALNPCESGVTRDSIRPLWNQTLKVRKFMTLSSSESPQKKRKLEQFLKDNFRGASWSASANSNQHNDAKLSGGQSSQASSVSSLHNSSNTMEHFDQKTSANSCSSGSLMTIERSFQRKQLSTGSSFPDNEPVWVQSTKDIFSLTDSDESVSGSNPLTPEIPRFYESLVGDEGDSVHSSSCSQLEEIRGTHSQSPRRSIRLRNFIGDHLQRLTIPIGPQFQADVPQWAGPSDAGHLNAEDSDFESSKWLGSRIWPIEDLNVEASEGVVGQGRHTSCSCACQGSTDCIKLHIREERISLQSSLGTAFLSWKFDEMGEDVSLVWTAKEQKTFEVLMKTNPKNFMKRALKSFPDKSKQNILSYYLNVFMPRCMSIQTRASLTQIDSEDEKWTDLNSVNLEGKRKRSRSVVGSSKNVKARYWLRR